MSNHQTEEFLESKHDAEEEKWCPEPENAFWDTKFVQGVGIVKTVIS